MYICTTKNRGVEQLVARRAHNPKVVGSSPAAATKKGLLCSTGLFYFLPLEAACTSNNYFERGLCKKPRDCHSAAGAAK